MASWSRVEEEAPELAGVARRFLDAHVHKTLATLRRDGSPRISGTEVVFADGELFIGSMWRSVKALDLQRDPRFALHSGSDDPPGWTGDAKLAGRMEEITDQERIAAVIGAPAPGGRCARIVALGSTASTHRSSGSYEPAPAPTFTTVRASPRARGSAGRCAGPGGGGGRRCARAARGRPAASSAGRYRPTRRRRAGPPRRGTRTWRPASA